MSDYPCPADLQQERRGDVLRFDMGGVPNFGCLLVAVSLFSLWLGPAAVMFPILGGLQLLTGEGTTPQPVIGALVLAGTLLPLGFFRMVWRWVWRVKKQRFWVESRRGQIVTLCPPGPKSQATQVNTGEIRQLRLHRKPPQRHWIEMRPCVLVAQLHDGTEVEIYNALDWPFVQYLGQELARHQKLAADLEPPG